MRKENPKQQNEKKKLMSKRTLSICLNTPSNLNKNLNSPKRIFSSEKKDHSLNNSHHQKPSIKNNNTFNLMDRATLSNKLYSFFFCRNILFRRFDYSSSEKKTRPKSSNKILYNDFIASEKKYIHKVINLIKNYFSVPFL